MEMVRIPFSLVYACEGDQSLMSHGFLMAFDKVSVVPLMFLRREIQVINL